MGTDMVGTEALKFRVSVGTEEMEEEVPSTYARLVAEQMRALRMRAGLNSEQMAAALSKELTRKILPPSLSRWENGHQLPLSDIFLATMRVAGLSLPSEAVDDQIRALQREIAVLTKQADTLARYQASYGSLPILPEAHRRNGKHLTITQAAKRVGRTRETMYSWVKRNRVRGYLWMGKIVVLPEDLDRLDAE